MKTTCGSMPRIPWRSPRAAVVEIDGHASGYPKWGHLQKEHQKRIRLQSVYSFMLPKFSPRILPERTQDEHKLCTSNDHHFDEKNVAPEFSSFFDAFFGEVLVHFWFSTGLSESISTSYQ